MKIRVAGLRLRVAVSAAVAFAAAGCAQTPVHHRLAATATGRCADTDFPVYFEDGSDRLTAPARQVLLSATARARGCRLVSGEIVGLAGADVSRSAAAALSQQRAVSVAQALAQAGLPGPALQLQAAGSRGAHAPGGRTAPMRHAAQVFLHFDHG